MEKLTRVRFSNLDKVLYPELGLTKADIIQYYIRVAPRMLPFLNDRALVRTRYPDGIDRESFYEKDAPRGKPDWVQTFTKYSRSVDKDTEYVVCNDLDTLIWLANLAALELHTPLSRITRPGEPDLALFDLDPEAPAGLTEAVQTAFIVKESIEDLGLKPYVKSSGKKGVHVVVPLQSGYTFKDTSDFVHSIAVMLGRQQDFIVSERSQTNDPGTVLIDYPQNSKRGTMIAPYSLRPLREATVSTPLVWRELSSLRKFDHNIFNVHGRKNGPWKGLWDEKFKLPSSNS
jgi:bifunctional non-homologous end joining protein LigD